MILTFPRSACGPLLAKSIVPFASYDGPLHWQERHLVEDDPAWIQPIPYAVLIDGHDRPWAYRRSGGDGRLQGRCSVGVGGHVDREDAREGWMGTLRAALLRELTEELEEFPLGLATTAPPIAWISEQESAVGRVHLGLVVAIPWLLTHPPRPRPGEALIPLGFTAPAFITRDNGFEYWSELAACALVGHSAPP